MKSILDGGRYSCSWWWYGPEFQENSNTSCFAGLQYVLKPDLYIYIYKYEATETLKYIPLIVDYINRITECELVVIENKKFIKFKVLETYDQSLALLNFIRLLWYSPNDYYNNLSKDTFSITFFETLQAQDVNQDPFKSLSIANMAACKAVPIKVRQGHSNQFEHLELKELTTQDLKAYKGKSIKELFTGTLPKTF